MKKIKITLLILPLVLIALLLLPIDGADKMLLSSTTAISTCVYCYYLVVANQKRDCEKFHDSINSMSAIRLIELINRWADDNSNYREVQNLWFILSALRGPDNEAIGLKARTTAVIRSKVLPDFSEKVGILFKHESSIEITDEEHETNNHFIQHIRLAASVLGIQIIRTPQTELPDEYQN